MNFRLGLVVGLFLFVSTVGFARDSNLERGGLGFVFPDHNSFANPGQFATSHGLAAQAEYVTDTKSRGPQIGDANVVFGNGMFGLGVDAIRVAPNVTKSAGALDGVTLGAGVSLIKERLTVGGSYTRLINANANGASFASGTVTLNSPNRHGPSIGVGVQTTLNTAVRTTAVTTGVGYSFHSNQSLEVNAVFNDTNNWKNYNVGTYFTTMSGPLYMGGGYVFHALTSNHEAIGRVGVVIGMRFDVSALVGYTFVNGNPITYGATARITF